MPRSFSCGLVQPFGQPATAILNLCGSPLRADAGVQFLGQPLRIDQAVQAIRSGASGDAANAFSRRGQLQPGFLHRCLEGLKIFEGNVRYLHPLPRRQVYRTIAETLGQEGHGR